MRRLSQAAYALVGVAGVVLGAAAVFAPALVIPEAGQIPTYAWAAVANTVPFLAFAVTVPLGATDHPSRQR